jgi:hypothetical protein
LNARSILVRSLIFGFALTAAAQVGGELVQDTSSVAFLGVVAGFILLPGEWLLAAITFGKTKAWEQWLSLVLNVLIWGLLFLAMYLIIKRLRHRRPISNVS